LINNEVTTNEWVFTFVLTKDKYASAYGCRFSKEAKKASLEDYKTCTTLHIHNI
jgi:hypothetical protein